MKRAVWAFTCPTAGKELSLLLGLPWLNNVNAKLSIRDRIIKSEIPIKKRMSSFFKNSKVIKFIKSKIKIPKIMVKETIDSEESNNKESFENEGPKSKFLAVIVSRLIAALFKVYDFFNIISHLTISRILPLKLNCQITRPFNSRYKKPKMATFEHKVYNQNTRMCSMLRTTRNLFFSYQASHHCSFSSSFPTSSLSFPIALISRRLRKTLFACQFSLALVSNFVSSTIWLFFDLEMTGLTIPPMLLHMHLLITLRI